MTEHEPEGSDPRAGRTVRPSVAASVPTHAEADLIVGMLRANGIDAHTAADDIGGAYPGLGVVRVVVDEADLEDAHALLESTAG
jgi:hypothetical protein